MGLGFGVGDGGFGHALLFGLHVTGLGFGG